MALMSPRGADSEASREQVQCSGQGWAGVRFSRSQGSAGVKAVGRAKGRRPRGSKSGERGLGCCGNNTTPCTPHQLYHSFTPATCAPPCLAAATRAPHAHVPTAQPPHPPPHPPPLPHSPTPPLQGLNRVVVCGSEGGMRELTWDTPDSHAITVIPPDEDGTVLTTLELDPSPTPRFLYAGTSTGAVRVYEWPLTGTSRPNGSFREFPAHASSSVLSTAANAENFGFHVGGIQSLGLARKGMLLLSAGDDGDMLVQGLALTEREIEIRSAKAGMPTHDDIMDEYNTDSVLVSQEFVDDLMAEQVSCQPELKLSHESHRYVSLESQSLS